MAYFTYIEVLSGDNTYIGKDSIHGAIAINDMHRDSRSGM